MKSMSLLQLRRNVAWLAIVLTASSAIASSPISDKEAARPALFPSLTEEPSVRFEVVESQKLPVIDKDHPDCKDDKYGLEGGVVLKLNGTYHLFSSENHGDPYIIKMRLAHWTSPDAINWKRQSTIFETTGQPIEVTGRPYASVWQPTPVFNEAENHWDLFYAAYKNGGASDGFIMGRCSRMARK